jgi:hypothetical protein
VVSERVSGVLGGLDATFDWLAARPPWIWFACLGGAGVVLLLVIVLTLRIIYQPHVPTTPSPRYDPAMLDVHPPRSQP